MKSKQQCTGRTTLPCKERPRSYSITASNYKLLCLQCTIVTFDKVPVGNDQTVASSTFQPLVGTGKSIARMSCIVPGSGLTRYAHARCIGSASSPLHLCPLVRGFVSQVQAQPLNSARWPWQYAISTGHASGQLRRLCQVASAASTGKASGSSQAPGVPRVHPHSTRMDAAQQAQAQRLKAWVLQHAGEGQLPTDANAVLLHGE